MESIPPSREHMNNAKTVRKQLLGDHSLYIESVGKIDMAHLAPDPRAEKTGKTVMRLILGATEEMPFRALSYIDTAIRTAHTLGSDIDQLQVIHANYVGNRINNINKFKSDDAAKRLADAAQEIAAMRSAGDLSILHAIDTPLDTKRFERLAKTALDSDPAIANKLMQRGAKHGGDALAYTAVHFAFQDTGLLELHPLLHDAPPQATGERIISLGCQQEQTFYQARMTMRNFTTDDDGMIANTAQIFTKHVVPPYYFARGGEPSLQEGVDPASLNLLGDDGLERLDAILDPAAQRDIKHFITVNNS